MKQKQTVKVILKQKQTVMVILKQNQTVKVILKQKQTVKVIFKPARFSSSSFPSPCRRRRRRKQHFRILLWKKLKESFKSAKVHVVKKMGIVEMFNKDKHVLQSVKKHGSKN